MTSWISRQLSGNRRQISAGTETAVVSDSVQNERFAGTETDVAMQKHLAYFLEAIHDEGLEAMFFEKIMPVGLAVAVDERGHVVYDTDEAGKVRVDGSGCPIPKYVETRNVDNYYAAMYNMSSQLNRLSHISPKMVKLHALYMEDIISDKLMRSPRSELNSGEIAYMNSLYNNLLILLQDATNGQKLTALLTLKKETAQSVNLTNQPDKKVF